ncbi:MAG: response regulator transcription factor [Firmicutes bacterium]|nr:response regulator transcription factor [Bacillota bacterium]
MKLLIIEDDLSIAELEKTYLDFYGYACDIAADGERGLALFEKENYCLVIVDVMLPGNMDGLDVCRAIRRRSDVPLIIVSAKADDADKIVALGLGIDDYVTKPFNAGELVARVKAHIARYEALTCKEAAPKKNTVEIRDIVIDKGSHKVIFRGQEVRFTEKEYQILLLLAENPDIAFTKDQIFDRVWGIDSMGDVSTVTVHVKKVRDKLENEGDLKPYIETVWGVGYRFRS